MPGDNFSLLKFINSTVMHMLAFGYLVIELQFKHRILIRTDVNTQILYYCNSSSSLFLRARTLTLFRMSRCFESPPPELLTQGTVLFCLLQKHKHPHLCVHKHI